MPIIKLSGFSQAAKKEVESLYPWEGAELLQGGDRGVVLGGANGSYRTAFVEAFIDKTFIRGEGENIEKAEKAAWKQYQKRQQCPGHEFEPRGYRNNAGFCKHCDTFQSNVIDPADFGFFCIECSTGTFDHETANGMYCKEHYPLKAEAEEYHELFVRSLEVIDDDEWETNRERQKVLQDKMKTFDKTGEIE